ncbi:MAG: O-antigen ligase domain-containing protein [Flavobacteriales bacterium]|nr:MAG: O-antigen ligase domain-containing protein [Flavobacteriales bacterium]
MNRVAVVLIHIGLIYFAATLSWQVKWLPTALGMMIAGLGWVISLRYSKFKLPPALWLPIILYLLLIAGLANTENTRKANQIISLSVPLLAFPLLFGLQQSRAISRLLLNIFIGVSILSAICTLGYLSYMLMLHPEGFTYRHYSPFANNPSHYLAMYFVFTGGCLTLEANRTKKPLMAALAGAFLLAVALLMNARIQYPLVGIILIWWAVKWLKHHPEKKWWVYGVSSFLLIIFFAFPENRRRLQETRDEFRNLANIDNSKQKNHRFYIWEHAMEVIEESPWIGTGTGNANDKLRIAYQKSDAQFWDGEKLYYLRDIGYNYHNQFLQSWAQNGIVALLCLLVILIVLWRNTSIPSRILALTLLFSMLTESILERQAGVFFISFIYCIVMTIPIKDEDIK